MGASENSKQSLSLATRAASAAFCSGWNRRASAAAAAASISNSRGIFHLRSTAEVKVLRFETTLMPGESVSPLCSLQQTGVKVGRLQQRASLETLLCAKL